MKKVFLLMAVSALCSAMAFAQDTKFGLRAGVNLAKFRLSGSDAEAAKDLANFKNQISFSVTGYADLALSEHFSIQPGIDVQGKGSKGTVELDGQTLESSSNLMYIGIPVNAVGKIPVSGNKIIFGAGPYFGYAIAGKEKNSAGDQSESNKYKFGNSEDDDINPIDYGINFLGGVELENGITIHAGYGLGLSNLVPKDIRGDSDGKISNGVLSFGLGFMF